jgi:hypothetical protein
VARMLMRLTLRSLRAEPECVQRFLAKFVNEKTGRRLLAIRR